MPDLETEREWKHESQFGTFGTFQTFAITSPNIRYAYEITDHDTIDEKAKQMVDCTDSNSFIRVCKAIAKWITGSQKYFMITDDHKSFRASTLCQDERMFWQNNNKAFSFPETSEKENSCYMKKCLNISFIYELSSIICLLNEIYGNSPNIDSSEDETFWDDIIRNLVLRIHRKKLYCFFQLHNLSETALTDSAFICLSAALGWDNPKQSEYWKSLRDGNPRSKIRSLQIEFIATKFLLQLQLSHDDLSVKALLRKESYEDDMIFLSQFQSSNNDASVSVKKVGYKDETNSVERTENGDNLAHGSKTSQNMSIEVILSQSRHDHVSVEALSVKKVGYKDETNFVERTENCDNLERGNKTSHNMSNTVNLSQSQSRDAHASLVSLPVKEVGCEDETNSVERTENSDNSDGLVFMNGEEKPIEKLIENQENVSETSDSKKFSKKSAVTRELEVMIEKNKRLFCEKQIPLKNVTSILNCLETFEEDPEMIKLMVPPPPRNLQDEKFRLSTFRGLRTQVYAAKEFARGGFYCEHDNVVVCYSCLLQHGIDDIVGSNPSDLQWHDHRCRHALKFRSIPPRGSNIDIVEEDGSCSDVIGDPPGQRSFYIPPGDVRMEAYRLSTFEQYPIVPEFLALPSFRRGLAKNGFYFTGFTDRVKCFSCGRSVDKWNGSDQIADQKWHKRTCSLKNGLQCDNVPIRFCFGDLLNTNAGHDTVLQQRNHNTGDIRTVRYPQDLPERVRQNGGSFNIGPGNEVQIQSGPVAQPRRGNADQPRQNVALNQISSGGHAPQPRGVPEPPREIPTWRMAAVASQDHRRFLTNLFLNRELDRITSYARWPSDRPNVPPAALAKTGFYYLGDMDRVQCFSCGGVLRNWSLDDNAEREHRAHFGGCHMVLGNEPSNLPIPTHPESSQLLAVNYPLRFPQNPHMRGQAQREQTFDRRWPTRALRVNVEEVAEAGFFYLGERDRVKCFYCNGGLQNWEFDDKPWDEHAKWFPNCQFLLRTKGQKFVSYHLAPNAQLARPIIARQDGSPLDRIGRPPVSSSRGHDIPPAERRPPTPPPTIIDPQAEMRERKERVKNIMRNSEVVKNVLTMGFSEQIVETLLIDRIVSNNEENPYDIYGTVSELLDDVMKKEEEIRQEEEERRDQTQSIFSNPSAYSSMSTSASTIGPAPGSGKYNVSYYGDDEDMNDVDMYGEGMEGTSDQGETAAKQLLNGSENTESIQSQMDKIEEERLCKICLSEVADMVFLPCSHMLCCMECTKAIKHCPVCRKRIERAIKTYVK